MRVSVLASGSGGNACVVESSRTRVLVDAGLSSKEIEKRLHARGVEPETIAAIFLTHEHGDHSIGALTYAARFGCPIFATAGTAAALGLEGNLFSPFVRMESCREGRVGDIGFRPLATPHDSNESVAYAFEADDARMVVASDLGHVQREFLDFLRGATTLLLEFNHDEDMLRDGPYVWALKRRIAGGFGHLSNRQSADALRATAGERLRRVIATHLSRTNNTPALALATLGSALELAESAATYGVADQFDGFETFDA
ncbi:MAG TPA: MBL fold metallo-hydrolase [Thermoanaerobaculia bacterium]|nr:MBL fold metallo-hydrolase [Thermoanaerobaculia bacterium]HLN93685.1 MBL fold metallo-hydrolase [Thermoanaerobaculia bacterium]